VKRTFWLLFLVGCGVLLCLDLLISREISRRSQIERARGAKNTLQMISSEAKPPNLARRLLRQGFPLLKGRPLDQQRAAAVTRRLVRGLPARACTVLLVDSNESLLWSSQPIPGIWAEVKNRLGGHWLKRYGLRTPIWRMVRLRERPNILAYWRHDVKAPPGTVAGMILIIDVVRWTRPMIVRHLVKRENLTGTANVGIWDRISPPESVIPTGIQPAELERLQARFVRRDGDLLTCREHIVVFQPFDQTKSLVALVSPEDRRPVRGAWIWLPVWIGLMALFQHHRKRGRLSMRTFLGLALGVSALLPLTLTLVFWFFFEQNRVSSLVSEELKAMEQRLIETDNAMTEVKRVRRARFQGLMARMEASLGNLDETLDAAGVLEREYQDFDIFFLVSSQGVHLRDFAMLDVAFRQIAPLPQREKLGRLQGLLDNTEMPPEKAVEMAVNMRLTKDFLPIFWSYKVSAEHSRKVREGLGALGKILVSRYNQMVGKDSVDGTGKKTDMVYGAVIDSQTGDLIQVALSTLGNIIRLGSGVLSSWVFVDVLKDADGIGQYFAMLFVDLRGPELQYLDRVFRETARWPPDYAFAAESFFSQAFFPVTERRHRLRRYFDRLVPPRVLYSRVLEGRRGKTLMASFAGRHLCHFILFATRPWSVIERRQNELRQRMALIAALMAALLLGISWRMYHGIIVPADALMAGIQAMERKTYTHRIPMLTGDEWDDIADSFNTAIAGLEELEVASVVQAMILPTGAVRGAGGFFLGKSSMTGQVGGDYYDAIANNDGSLNFVIGDVTGHGVSAALVVAMAKSSFQILHRSGVRSPAEILSRMNRLILNHLAKKKALTMQAGWLSADGRLVFCNAGHPYPYLLSADGAVRHVEQKNFPLGTVKKSRYIDLEVSLTGPATLVMYTDGIIEQTRADGVRYGLSGLENEIRAAGTGDPEALTRIIHEGLRTFTQGKAWDDDVTLAFLRVTGPAPEVAPTPSPVPAPSPAPGAGSSS
jgi:hypothetical protein